MADFTYSDDGLFVAIFPETSQATKVWNDEIGPKTANTGKVLASQFPEVKAKLKAAGYKIRKSTKVKESDDELLNDLIE